MTIPSDVARTQQAIDEVYDELNRPPNEALSTTARYTDGDNEHETLATAEDEGYLYRCDQEFPKDTETDETSAGLAY